MQICKDPSFFFTSATDEAKGLELCLICPSVNSSWLALSLSMRWDVDKEW